MEQPEPPRLLAIVGVPPKERVLCGQPGCGHGVYAEIHVVQDAGKLLVLGSTCFAKRYGSPKALGTASVGGGGGRQLTPEERVLLVGVSSFSVQYVTVRKASTGAGVVWVDR